MLIYGLWTKPTSSWNRDVVKVMTVLSTRRSQPAEGSFAKVAQGEASKHAMKPGCEEPMEDVRPGRVNFEHHVDTSLAGVCNDIEETFWAV